MALARTPALVAVVVMASVVDCPSCAWGNHDGHNAEHGILPDLIGGKYCDCRGDCAERAKTESDALAKTMAFPPPRGGLRYTSYLTRPQLWALDEACKTLPRQWLGSPYLVGSVLQRPDFRDVDIRMMLDDDTYDALPDEAWGFFGFVTSRHLAAVTGLPIDFQIQRKTDANERYRGQPRNPIGNRKLGSDWIGDQRPNRICERAPHLLTTSGTTPSTGGWAGT